MATVRWLILGALMFASAALGEGSPALPGLQMVPSPRLRGAELISFIDWTNPKESAWARIEEFPRWGGNVFRVHLTAFLDGAPVLPGRPLAERVLKVLERYSSVIEWSLSHNIHIIIAFDTHYVWPPPEGWWPDDGRLLWGDVSAQEELIAAWTALAARYRGRPGLLFDLLNEPQPGPSEAFEYRPLMNTWNSLHQRIVEAVRSIDPERWFIVEPLWGGGWPNIDVEFRDTRNMIFSFHLYEPVYFTTQGVPPYPAAGTVVYPGLTRSQPGDPESYFDRARLATFMQPAVEYRQKTGVRVMCGEFGVSFGAPADSRRRWATDVSELCEQNGFDWSYFTYDAGHSGGWGFEGTNFEDVITSKFALNFVSNVPATLGTAAVLANPYGVLSVQGGALVGNTISNLQSGVVIQLGATAGSAGSSAEFDFHGLNIGPGNSLTVRSGAPGQSVMLVNDDGSASSIAGTLRAESANGAAAPVVFLKNPNGITVEPSGNVIAPEGLTVNALGATSKVGQPIVNNGVLDGGSNLRLFGSKVTGGGDFKGNSVTVSTFGIANNPANGAHFLSNGIQLFPSSGATVALTLNGYGIAPQALNVKVNGNAVVAMPSAWAAGSSLPPNNLTVPPGGTVPAGAPAPAFGGGSMIVQATGTFTLANGGTNDFVFPGAIVLKSAGDLNVNGVVVNNSWTGAGQSFQGVFFESPNIVNNIGNITVLTNNLNWINFSTLPHSPVRAGQLVPAADGSLRHLAADSIAPHRNTYSILIEAAATGQCWVCLVNTAPVNMQ